MFLDCAVPENIHIPSPRHHRGDLDIPVGVRVEVEGGGGACKKNKNGKTE